MNNKYNSALAFTIFIFVVLGCTPPKNQSSGNSAGSQTSSASAQPSANSSPAANWNYTEQADPMTSRQTNFATVISTNELDFDFPYQGGSYGKLTIRRKDGSDDVMLSISKGQFMGNYNDRRKVNLRFDEKPAFSVGYSEPSDSSSDMIFLSSEKKIIDELKKASKLKVQVEFFNQGTRVLEFDIKDFKWGK